jgi:hypothetical protein
MRSPAAVNGRANRKSKAWAGLEDRYYIFAPIDATDVGVNDASPLNRSVASTEHFHSAPTR